MASRLRDAGNVKRQGGETDTITIAKGSLLSSNCRRRAVLRRRNAVPGEGEGGGVENLDVDEGADEVWGSVEEDDLVVARAAADLGGPFGVDGLDEDLFGAADEAASASEGDGFLEVVDFPKASVLGGVVELGGPDLRQGIKGEERVLRRALERLARDVAGDVERAQGAFVFRGDVAAGVVQRRGLRALLERPLDQRLHGRHRVIAFLPSERRPQHVDRRSSFFSKTRFFSEEERLEGV
mmetsp:Transcript_21606/g.66598  ORF Transcript_21606/g.66598 Transcript_21606/m.66598 type:complete len:239 (+) Transcript_21606:70-786(+)